MFEKQRYLSTYRYIDSDADSRYYGLPSYMYLDSANGYCGAIQAITLSRGYIKGDNLRQYNGTIVNIIASNPWLALATPKARKHHKARLRGLAGVPDDDIVAIATEILRVRNQRWQWDSKCVDGMGQGIFSEATRSIDEARRRIQSAWQKRQRPDVTDPVIKAGVLWYSRVKLSCAKLNDRWASASPRKRSLSTGHGPAR